MDNAGLYHQPYSAGFQPGFARSCRHVRESTWAARKCYALGLTENSEFSVDLLCRQMLQTGILERALSLMPWKFLELQPYGSKDSYF